MRPWGYLATAVAALALAAAGCGGEDQPAPEPQERTIAGDPETTAQGTEQPDGEPGAEAPSRPRERNGRDENGGPEQRPLRPLTVEDVTAAVLSKSGEPELVCDELVTERFLRTAYGSRQGCVAAAVPGARAKRVEITRVRESGDEASALAVPSGGPYDGIELQVELVADPQLEGAWLLDSLVADVPPGP